MINRAVSFYSDVICIASNVESLGLAAVHGAGVHTNLADVESVNNRIRHIQ